MDQTVRDYVVEQTHRLMEAFSCSGEAKEAAQAWLAALGTDREGDIKRVLTIVYDALREKGYNPINQMVGYILSEDPTYITTHNNARSLIRRIDRDELLQVLLKSYLDG